MKSRLCAEEPGKIVYKVTTIGTAAEWEAFREALDFVAMKSTKVPDAVHHFRQQIDDMLAQARKIYWPTEPAPLHPKQDSAP